VAASSIGIKIADGSYYRVLQEGSAARKRVILTTVQDNQTGAQIDLYRGNGSGIAGARYIGSLVIDEIERAAKGKPEIELIVGVDGKGNLEAQASEKSTGDRQTLSVALDSLGESESFVAPDFDLDEQYQPELGVSPAEASRLTSEPFAEEISPADGDLGRMRRRRVVQFVGLGLLAVIVIVLVVLLVLRLTHTTHANVASTPPAAVSAQAPKAPPTAASPAATPAAGAAGTQPATPAALPAGRQGGVQYYIRWGDTLWDLSISFYRTPWLYGRIAKANNIKNPDLIFAHTEIYIPER